LTKKQVAEKEAAMKRKEKRLETHKDNSGSRFFLQVTGHRLQVAGCRLQVAGCR